MIFFDVDEESFGPKYDLCSYIFAESVKEKQQFPLYLWDKNKNMYFSKYKKSNFIFYGCRDNTSHLKYIKSPRVFLTIENSYPRVFEYDFALTHKRIFSKKHWRFPVWRQAIYSSNYPLNERRNFEEVKNRMTKFCNFVVTNPSGKERIKFFNKLNNIKRVDSAGRLANNIGYTVKDKIKFISNYKFSIAFENCSHPGYITEKIMEALLVGSIPIYWGAPDIDLDINPDCFINVQKFANWSEAIRHIMKVDSSESLWRSYINAPIFKNNKIPQEYTDESYINFMESILKTKHTVPIFFKRFQKIMYNKWKIRTNLI